MALLLDSLLIENYRVFKRLEIERLGRVNLFVGKNNSGKSSVLEAVRLYASAGSPNVLLSILETHESVNLNERDVQERGLAIKQWFHGRDANWSQNTRVTIGPIQNHARTLSLQLVDIPANETLGTDAPPNLALGIRFNGATRTLRLDSDSEAWQFFSTWKAPAEARHAFVPPNGVAGESAADLWDEIALTELEQHVIDVLRIIDRDIERIAIVGERTGGRVAKIKLKSQARPVSLHTLGDGVNRLLGMALSLVSARGGVLLIDEVENGVHFKAQNRLWESVFQLSHDLDVQVFATTHSWDCIEAFQRAAASDPHEEAALIRLDIRDNSVAPTMFSEDELAIVTRDQIEVR